MKASVHFGRGNADHNDRSYDKSEKEHDIIKATIGDRNKTFYENEIDIYQKLYEEKRLRTNENYIKNGHPERCTKTIEDYYKKNVPTELILQIGNKEKSVGGEVLKKATEELIRELQKKGVKALNYAIHRDETTEHAHIRMTFPHEKNGVIENNRAQFLKDVGYELPKPEEKEGRYNNRMISFTDDVRERFISIVREKGLEIENRELDEAKEHKRSLSVHDFQLKADRDQEDLLREMRRGQEIRAYEKMIKSLNEGKITPKEINALVEQKEEQIQDLRYKLFGEPKEEKDWDIELER